LNETQGLYGPRAARLQSASLALTRRAVVARPNIRALARSAAAPFAFGSTLAVAAIGAHVPLDIKPGLAAQMLAGTVPFVAAVLAFYAVRRPWPAFLAIVLLTPVLNAGQVSWDIEWFQVILQTVFVVWLAVGLLLREPSPAHAGVERRARPVRPASAGAKADLSARSLEFASRHLGPLAALALVVLASVSTLASPDVLTSSLVLVHGIYEPVAMGLLLLAFRPNRRQIMLLLTALGFSVALGGLINIVQSVPAFGSLGALQAKRLLFSRLTYFNVGLFGEMLAMAAPLLLGALVYRRQLGLGRYAILLPATALAVGGASLFLTFSKSAYLATAGGILVFCLLLAGTRRTRLRIVAASIALSAVVVPWPAFFLQISPTLSNVYRGAMVDVMGSSRYESWNPSQLSGHGSLVERAYATQAAVEMAADHPWLGIGLDQFGEMYRGQYKSPDSHFAADSAHTFWPEVAAELGIPALVLVVLIFFSALLALWRLYMSPPDAVTRLLAITLLGSLAAWLAVATAFAGDMYRPWRNMSSDFVMMALLTAAAFALVRATRSSRG
jgi:hypothetical protein